MTIKINGANCHTRAEFVSESFNESDRTIEVVWTTGASGLRSSYSIGRYMEELSLKKSDVRMDRLNNGAPFLAQHNSYSLDANLGIVQKAWLSKGEGRATIKLSGRDEVQGIIRDIKDGVLKNISVGYKVHKFQDVSKKNDEIPTYRAIDWEPLEISLVNVAFDHKSQIRSNENDQDSYEVELIENEELGMTVKKRDDETADVNNVVEENAQVTETIVAETTTEPVVPAEPAAETTTEVRSATSTQEPVMDQLERVKLINSAVDAAKLDRSFADTLIHNKDITVDLAREAIIKKMGENNSINTNNNRVEVNDVSNRNLRIEAATSALLNRADSSHKLADDAREYRGMSLVRMAEEVLGHQNISTKGLTSNEIAERALHSTSDFVEILANVANKTLRKGYDEQAQTFAPITREVTVSDFKEISRTQLGDAPAFEKVNEHGEYKSGKIGEAAEKYKIETYGKIVGITRQTLINDDMDAFSRIPEMFGRRARDLESQLIWSQILSNPIMADGFALFSAQHGNLATAALIGVGSIAEMREKMRLQKGLGDLLLNLMPKYLVTPVALETAAEQFLGPIAATENGKVNPFTGKLMNISEARIDAVSRTGYYLMADKGQIDMIELARLAGQETPRITSKEGFNVDGVQFKVSYDIGVKVIDHRGMVFNPGL